MLKCSLFLNISLLLLTLLEKFYNNVCRFLEVARKIIPLSRTSYRDKIADFSTIAKINTYISQIPCGHSRLFSKKRKVSIR
ncbi:hypothetical protein CQA44_08645 [Helicobacter sp. MIT 14-3879]|nr:hypothetical protein CQA44_08645 [Helicobacter sp. MIT 14-3879]